MRKVLAAIALVALLLVADVALLAWLGTLVGVWPVLTLVLVSAVLGAWLTKHEGLRVLGEARDALARGRMPEDGLVGGLLVLVGGLLLITPGVLTDVAGTLLLVPATRRWIALRARRGLERWWARRAGGPVAAVPGPDGSVAAEVVEIDDEVDRAARSSFGFGRGFAVWSFSTRGGPFVYADAPRSSARSRHPDIIDVEAEEVIVEDEVPPSRRLPG